MLIGVTTYAGDVVIVKFAELVPAKIVTGLVGNCALGLFDDN